MRLAIEEEESPYTSFADLLVGMVFIFLLVIALLVLQVRPKVERVRDDSGDKEVGLLQNTLTRTLIRLDQSVPKEEIVKLNGVIADLQSGLAGEKAAHTNDAASFQAQISQLSKSDQKHEAALKEAISPAELSELKALNEELKAKIAAQGVAASQAHAADLQANSNLQKEIERLQGVAAGSTSTLQQEAAGRKGDAVQAAAQIAALKDQLAAAQKAVENGKYDRARAVQASLAAFLTELAHALSDDGIRVTVDANRGSLLLPDSILFGSGQSELSSSGEEAVSRLSQELARLLPCHVANLPLVAGNDCRPNRIRFDTVFIEGHTDRVPVRPGAHRYLDNFELSAERATSVYFGLVQSRPELSNARSYKPESAGSQSLFGVAGYGDTRPLAISQTKDDPRLRRIELRFLPAQE